jgi:iron complex outermembrane receptor protein
MNNIFFPRRAPAAVPAASTRATVVAALALLAGTSAWAQTGETPSLAPVVVTGNPLGATELIAPAAQYSGDELLLRTRSTLGETFDGTPGVSSTYFGPNASRPVIRGLDGDRIRILNNGGASGDVSSLSYDHAVTIDPLTIERVEVLRGPAALQYGGSAVGGVVNVIDNRIPREALFDARGGVAGKADAALASGNREHSGSMMLESGTDRYALHADVMSRNTQDVNVPADLACTRGGVTTTARRICNSASEAWGGAVGGSLFFDRGYVGASLAGFGTRYGTVAEDEVSIGMQSSRFALEGEVRDLGGALQSIKGQFSRNDYRHTEFNAGTPGTLFRNSGNDLRLQARHARLGALDGVVGLQYEDGEFSADGSEAFAPYSRTRQGAMFAHEELGTRWGRLSAGARLESVQVDSLGHPTLTRFVAAQRNFMPASYALGALWNVAREWQLTSNLSWSQRAPKDYELYADGVHVATNAYENGDANLGLERSKNLDVGFNWKRGAHSAGLQAFVNQFDNYISLEATGQNVTVDGTSYAGYRYTQVRARFTGLEANGKVRLLDGARTLDLALRADAVRADNLDTDQPLPRIAPMRLGATLLWSQGPWGARLGVDQITAQDRVPTGQLAVAGYTLWNAALTYRARAGRSNLLWYARLDNLGDTLAYSASSILTQTAAGKAPLPGRSLRAGVQVSF